MKKTAVLTTTALLCGLMISCSSGSTSKELAASVFVKQTSTDVSAECPQGGVKIELGLDTNKNNVLDPAEVIRTEWVCNGKDGTNGKAGADGTDGTAGTNGTNGTDGTNGTNGLNALVNITDEPAGTNCTAGGKKIASGTDTNNNGTLDEAEIIKTEYICNGTNGAAGTDGENGTNGKDGANTIIITTKEGPGTNCANGGYKIEIGVDTDGDLTLDPAETQTLFVCNGADGAKGDTGDSGTDGADGYSCWDLNKNHACDLVTEDINLDSDCTPADCKGTDGNDGTNGVCANNAAPVIDSITIPASPITTTSFEITINATDADATDVLEYTVIGSGAQIVQTGTTNKFTITPAEGGSYSFTATVSDGCQIKTKTFSFTLRYTYTTDTAKDVVTGLTWQRNKQAGTYTWDAAGTYCANLELGGYSDWRIPNITELRTIIINCPGTVTGGACAINDPGHLSNSEWSIETCNFCDYTTDGRYSVFGDNQVYLWSSSTYADLTTLAWHASFFNGSVYNNYKDHDANVRCVR